MSENRLHPPPFAENNGRAEPYPTLLPKPHRSVTGLPRFLTTFIGRDEAIGNVTALLSRDDVRMLTLVGPGGSGKTRLAVEVVERLPPGAWDDIWFISLAAVRDPEFVVPDIAQAVGVGQVSDRPVAETLIGFLRERHALLVIDNFEPVVAAGPDLAILLRACPGITMLVTSRIALQVSGEHIVVVPPLELPGTTHLPIERLRSLESVRLFVERAEASSSTFALTEENASVVVDICRRLDGLPLALELAAARCGMLSPAALLQVLAHQRGILSDGPRDAPERHRSMRSAIA
ncbi:MAG TPA: NB-ARC domain-containing protein, partial [Thermomicrobiales bacterium]|nr:NB-ARC domain-containing protein [Thermomicrobiales bacterium]